LNATAHWHAAWSSGRDGLLTEDQREGSRARAEGFSGLLRAVRQSRFSLRSYMGRKTSRGDIVIGRPAISL
jgi:hypothetical protein